MSVKKTKSNHCVLKSNHCVLGVELMSGEFSAPAENDGISQSG